MAKSDKQQTKQQEEVKDVAKAQEAQEAQSTELTTTQPAGGAPSFLQDKMKQDAGKGVSTDQADNIVPMVYLLQGLSPQVNEQESAYIQGAKAGHIWLKNSPDPIVKGSDGILFQPCYFYKKWVEWIPREDGGGFVGNYDERPEAAVEKPDPRDPTGKTMIWTMPNGNQLKETRYHAGRVFINGLKLPYVIPLTGTGHTSSRNWMFLMNSKRDADGNIYPSYSSLYRLVSKMKKNKKGTFFVFEAADAGYVDSVADYDAGKSIYEAFLAGDLKAETETAVGGEDGGEGGDDSTAAM